MIGVRAGAFLAALALAGVLVLARAARAQDAELRDGEVATDSASVWPGAEPEGWEDGWWVRLVDALDGEPMSGARVSVPWHPTGAVLPETRYSMFATHAGPWAWLPSAVCAGWRDYIIGDAPGYAPTEHCISGRVELIRGTDVPVVVLDQLGRTVPGARVVLNLGCGHIPDQRTAQADPSGRAVLRAILPERREEDVWVDAPGVDTAYVRLADTWRPGAPPVEVHVRPATHAEGRIVWADGTPCAFHEVGVPDAWRPRTYTDRDGRFRLEGLPAWSRIELRLAGRDDVWFFAAPAGTERTFRIGEEPGGRAFMVLVTADDGAAAPDVRVALVRDGDGATCVATTDEFGRAQVDVPDGAYRVLADGELREFGTAEARVTVGADAPAELRVTVPRLPRLRIDATQLEGLDVEVGVATATAYRVVRAGELASGSIAVPRERPARIRIEGEETGLRSVVTFVDLPEDPDAAPPLVLAWAAPAHIVAHGTGPDGASVPATLRLERDPYWTGLQARPAEEECAREPSAATRLLGPLTWMLVPADAALAPAWGTVDVRGHGARIDLGEVRLAAADDVRLRIVLPEDVGAEDVSVALRDPDGREIGTWGVRPDGALDDDGAAPLLPGGFVQVHVDRDGFLDWRAPLPDGPLPHVLRYPDGVLRLRVRSSPRGVDEDAGPLAEAVVFVDTEPVEPDALPDGTLVIAGVERGRHRVVVAESAHLTKVLDLRCDDGDDRTLEVRLTPR